MKSLITIQKTFKVFKTLSMIAMIVSFIAAGTALLGLLCVIEWQSEGMLGFGKSVMAFTGTTSLEPAICVLLSDTVFALTDGFLCLFAWNYFKTELTDGTPFTHSGADKVKSLGTGQKQNCWTPAGLYQPRGMDHCPGNARSPGKP